MTFGDTVHYREPSVKKVGEIAEKIGRKKKFHNRSKYGALLRAWENVVGQEIYEGTRIISYEHGKIRVSVDSPVLLHALKGFMEKSILEQLKQTDGGEDVSDVFFLAG